MSERSKKILNLALGTVSSEQNIFEEISNINIEELPIIFAEGNVFKNLENDVDVNTLSQDMMYSYPTTVENDGPVNFCSVMPTIQHPKITILQNIPLTPLTTTDYENQSKSGDNPLTDFETDPLVDDILLNNTTNQNETEIESSKSPDVAIYFSTNAVTDHNGLNDVSNLNETAAEEYEKNATPILPSSAERKESQLLDNHIQTDSDDGENQRKRRKLTNSDTWKKNTNKKLRMEGKQYLGYTRRNGTVHHNTIRESRKLGPTCQSRNCARSKKRFCSDFSEIHRKKLFDHFWSETSWDQKKIFVASHVSRVNPKRKTTEGNSRREGTFLYNLPMKGYDKKVVCRTMFLNTLGLRPFTVQSWVNQSTYNIIPQQEVARSKRKLPLSGKASDLEFLNTFIDKLPKLPSHYSRKDTSKLYLEPIFVSMQDLLNHYRNYCQEQDRTPLSRQVFTKKLQEKNISIYQKKKDQCDTCAAYNVGNVSNEEWSLHIGKKDRARDEKEIDKIHAQENVCITLTMDLQAVKVSPNVNASAIFFKTKLCCYNFTVYNLESHQVVCYWFTEVDSDLQASTFTSIILEHLEKYCVSKKLPIVIFSDGCTYQNRNNILANALLDFSMKHDVEIFQKFLERGHTQMECDSVHALIERKLKGKDIYLPADYVRATMEARKKPVPYETRVLKRTFFKNFAEKKGMRYHSIRPGRFKNDPTVTDVKALSYSPDSIIRYKLDFDDEWRELPIRPKSIAVTDCSYPQLHKSTLKLSYSKWKHLQELKSVIPEDCHTFYDNLPTNEKD